MIRCRPSVPRSPRSYRRYRRTAPRWPSPPCWRRPRRLQMGNHPRDQGLQILAAEELALVAEPHAMARGERLDIFQRGVDLLRERTICGDILLVVFIEAWERNGQEVFVVLVAQIDGENGAFPPTRDGCIHSLSMRERG